MKLIYVLIDGMGDVPIKELGKKTPLAAADTPTLDFLATNGKTGLIYTVNSTIAPESDAGVISLLGYDPFEYETSRGVMEAIGAKMAFKDNYLALRCNFASIDSEGKIIDRRAGRDLSREDGERLSEEINAKIKLTSHSAHFTFKNTIGHRGVLVIQGLDGSLSGKITNSDPAYTRVGGMGVVNTKAAMILQRCKPMDGTKEAKIAADLVNEFIDKSRMVLEESSVNKRRFAGHKLRANGILTRDAGHLLPKFFNINKRYNVKFCCLADMPLEIGIARLTGMETIGLQPPSGDLVKDCQIRVKKLLTVLKLYDCFYIHIKGPDEPGHDGNYNLKRDMISTIDKHFFRTLLLKIGLDEALFCVTADHATPCQLKSHSNDPVPILISGNKIKGNGTTDFSEESCKNGSLGTIEHGFELMPKLMDLKQV